MIESPAKWEVSDYLVVVGAFFYVAGFVGGFIDLYLSWLIPLGLAVAALGGYIAK